MTYKIEPSNCVACGQCVAACQVAAIVPKDGKYEIDPAKCAQCAACISACPVGAITQA